MEKSGKSLITISPLLQYVFDHSTPLNEHVEKLMQSSFKHPQYEIMGAKAVLQLCSAAIDMIQAKNVLDIGLFTGVSALTWATTIPEDGKVISMDIEDNAYVTIGKSIIEASGVAHKIDIRIQPALKTLQELIDDGQSGKYDFAFLDANKVEYPKYYLLCLELLRPGGVMAVDNALWYEKVLSKKKDEATTAIHKLNELASTDPRVRSVLLSIEDGLHLIVKKSST